MYVMCHLRTPALQKRRAFTGCGLVCLVLADANQQRRCVKGQVAALVASNLLGTMLSFDCYFTHLRTAVEKGGKDGDLLRR